MLKLLISGEASRLQPGDATLRVLVSDLLGKKVAGGDMPLTHGNEDTLPFSTNVSVPPGTYIVRVAVMDSGGRVGSVDHRADARDVQLGPLTATGPVLVRVPRNDRDAVSRPGFRPAGRAARARAGSRRRRHSLWKQRTSSSKSRQPSTDRLSFVQPLRHFHAGSRQGMAVAQAVADMRVPPGWYILVRAKVKSETKQSANCVARLP